MTDVGSSGSQHDEAWWVPATVLAGAIGAAGAVAAPGAGGRLEIGALTVVVMAGFVVRHRWPRMPAALLASWTFVPPIALTLHGRGEGIVFLLIISLCFLVLVTPDRRVRGVAGMIAMLAPPAIQAISPTDWGWPFWMMGIGFGWLSAEQMRRLRDLATELAATRALVAEQAVHVERRRIAAELHDLVGHSLTVMLLSVTGARRLVGNDPEAATEALREAETIGRASLAEIRGNVRALRGDDVTGPGATPTPSAGDVPDLVERMVATGSSVDLDITGDVAGVEPVTGLVVYRVVQESLNNAARHAAGAPAQVAVVVGADAVDVDVFDHGPGHPPSVDPSRSGVGLIGMQERVEAVGGTLQAGPVAGGWRVRAHVPRRPAAPGPGPP